MIITTPEKINNLMFSFLAQDGQNENSQTLATDLLSLLNCVKEISQRPFIRTPFPYLSVSHTDINNIISHIIKKQEVKINEIIPNTQDIFGIKFTENNYLNKIRLSTFILYFMYSVLIYTKSDFFKLNKTVNREFIEKEIRLLFFSVKNATGKEFLERAEKKILYMTLLSIPKFFSKKIPETNQTPVEFFEHHLRQLFADEKDISLLAEIANLYGSFNYWNTIFPYHTQLITKEQAFINNQSNLENFLFCKTREISEEIADSCKIRNGTIEQMNEKFSILFKDKILIDNYGKYFFQFGAQLFHIFFINEFYFLWNLNSANKTSLLSQEKKTLNNIFKKIQKISLFYTKDPETMIETLFEEFKVLVKAFFPIEEEWFNQSFVSREKSIDILVKYCPLCNEDKKATATILKKILKDRTKHSSSFFYDQNLFLAWKQGMMQKKIFSSFKNETTDNDSIDR